jgi:hypothetical protein
MQSDTTAAAAAAAAAADDDDDVDYQSSGCILRLVSASPACLSFAASQNERINSGIQFEKMSRHQQQLLIEQAISTDDAALLQSCAALQQSP